MEILDVNVVVQKQVYFHQYKQQKNLVSVVAAVVEKITGKRTVI